MQSKELWDLESAMKVLKHHSVDSKLWAEAVEWLIFYGPPEVRQLLIDASSTATRTYFPQLKPTHFTPEGQACYNIAELAESLGIEVEEARKILQEKEEEHQLSQLFDHNGTDTVH